MTTVVIALICMSLIGVVPVVVARISTRTLTPTATSFLATAGVAGLAAVASSVVYALFVSSGSTVVLAAVDAAMVLAPALLWVAVRQLNGRQRNGVWIVGPSAAAVFAVSLLLPQPIPLFVRVAALATFCILVAVEGSLGSAGRIRGMRWTTVAMICYAVFSVGRLVTGIGFGTDAEVYEALFSTRASTIAATVVVGPVGVGVLLTARALRVPAERIDALSGRRLRQSADLLLAEHGSVRWHRVVVEDFALLRRAHGRPYADGLYGTLLSACVATAPASRIVGSVEGGTAIVLGPEDGGGGADRGRGEDRGRGLDIALLRERIARHIQATEKDDTPGRGVASGAGGAPAFEAATTPDQAPGLDVVPALEVSTGTVSSKDELARVLR